MSAPFVIFEVMFAVSLGSEPTEADDIQHVHPPLHAYCYLQQSLSTPSSNVCLCLVMQVQNVNEVILQIKLFTSQLLVCQNTKVSLEQWFSNAGTGPSSGDTRSSAVDLLSVRCHLFLRSFSPDLILI